MGRRYVFRFNCLREIFTLPVTVLREIEEEDEAWEQSRRKKPKHGRNLEPENTPTNAQPTNTIAETENQHSKPKSNAPAGFY